MKPIVAPVVVALVVGLSAPVFGQLARDDAIAKAEAISRTFRTAGLRTS